MSRRVTIDMPSVAGVVHPRTRFLSSVHTHQSWYAVLAPYPNPKIVTVVTMEEGGFGVESAAPAARTILEAYFAKQLKHEGEKGEPEEGPAG